MELPVTVKSEKINFYVLQEVNLFVFNKFYATEEYIAQT